MIVHGLEKPGWVKVAWDNLTCLNAGLPDSIFLFIFYLSNYIDGLVLVPTGENKREYRRIGIVCQPTALGLDTSSGEKSKQAEQILKIGRDSTLISAEFYTDYIPEKGFDVEII